VRSARRGAATRDSTDGGKSFASISTGWKATLTNDAAFDSAATPSLYVAFKEGIGVLKTQDRGKSYQHLVDPVDPTDPNARVRTLAIAATNPQLIFAGTFTNGLFRSTNAGQSWTRSFVDTGGEEFRKQNSQIAVDPGNPNNVYFATDGVFGGLPGFYRSTDGGSTFRQTAQDQYTKVAIDPVNRNVIYASGLSQLDYQEHLFKSINGGLSFTETSFLATPPDRIVVSPAAPGNVYLSAQFGVIEDSSQRHYLARSSDGGSTFAGADTGLPAVIDFALDPQNPARLYAWTQGGLFGSNDRGASWTLLEGDQTLKASQVDGILKINPQKPNLLYLIGNSILEVEIHNF